MNSEELNELIRKYNRGTCSEEERQLLDQWFASFQWDGTEFTDADELARMKAESLAALQPYQQQTSIRRRAPVRMLMWASAAACLLLAVSGIWWYSIRGSAGKQATRTVLAAAGKPMTGDFQPGNSRATLTLADGTKITLDEAGSGALARQEGVVIRKQGPKIVYDISSLHDQFSVVGNKDEQAAMNTMSTGRGGQYQLILPDGSKVWLNAESSIRYPTIFPGGERRVVLTGEAYFEVAKEDKPFIVAVSSGDGRDAEVQVLGTWFDVNAYRDEQSVKTTLLEGKVRVVRKAGSGEALLRPGQQANIGGKPGIDVANNVDVHGIIAWKNGYFDFDNVPISVVMRQMARWYDMDVKYEGDLSRRVSIINVSRQVPASKMLHIMELTGKIHFVVVGKTVLVKI